MDQIRKLLLKDKIEKSIPSQYNNPKIKSILLRIISHTRFIRYDAIQGTHR